MPPPQQLYMGPPQPGMPVGAPPPGYPQGGPAPMVYPTQPPGIVTMGSQPMGLNNPQCAAGQHVWVEGGPSPIAWILTIVCCLIIFPCNFLFLLCFKEKRCVNCGITIS